MSRKNKTLAEKVFFEYAEYEYKVPTGSKVITYINFVRAVQNGDIIITTTKEKFLSQSSREV
jgi:hypothetical protein